MSIAVAKDFEKNRKLRMGLLWDGAHDRLAARQIREECGKDLLFYVNLFCWTYDPRRIRTYRSSRTRSRTTRFWR